MKKEIVTSILAIGFTTALAIAAGPPVSYIFQGGDPASATQVNANFQELADRIADAQASDVYDFHNYIATSSIQSKVFDTTGICGDKETRTYTRSDVAAGTEITEKRINTNSGTPCSHHEYDSLSSTTEYQFLASRTYDPATSALVGTTTLDKPVTRLSSAMKNNTSWADATTYTATPPGTVTIIIEKNTLAGIEDVTVPYNGGTTYTACLKIHRTSKFPVEDFTVTAGYSESVIWFCPGIGNTKSITINTGGNVVTRELSDIQ